MTEQCEAWAPSAEDLAHLIAKFDNCSHVHLGQWSFWQNQDPKHLCICARTGRAFLVDTRMNRTQWVSPGDAQLFGWAKEGTCA